MYVLIYYFIAFMKMYIQSTQDYRDKEYLLLFIHILSKNPKYFFSDPEVTFLWSAKRL